MRVAHRECLCYYNGVKGDREYINNIFYLLELRLQSIIECDNIIGVVMNKYYFLRKVAFVCVL